MGLSVDGARWLADRGTRLVGNDYLSVQAYREPADVHMALASFAQGNDRGDRDATFWWLQIMGRLREGATAEQVRGNLNGPFRASARARPTPCCLSGSRTSTSRCRNGWTA